MKIDSDSETLIRQWRGEDLIPRRVTIETIFGCNAACRMCVINHPTPRRKAVMPQGLFEAIVDRLIPYREHLQFFDLFGLGEPLLDPHIFTRIRHVKSKKFRSLAISTNADLLDEDKRHRLLDTGIDTVLFSVDGFRKETHENIRCGVNFERVIHNIRRTMELRDTHGYPTRFVVRFIRRPDNRDEWPAYKAFWESLISPDKRDKVIAYNMHSWGGEIAAGEDILESCSFPPEIKQQLSAAPCHHIFFNLLILSDGSVPLCSEDLLKADHSMGNATIAPLADIFNSSRFKNIRTLHVNGKKNQMMPCRECTVLHSEHFG